MLSRKDQMLYEEVVVHTGCNLTEDMFGNLANDQKLAIAKGLATSLFSMISERLNNVDLSVVDASRGNFAKIKDISYIIDQLNTIIDLAKNKSGVYESAAKEAELILKLINHLSLFAGIFENGYKTQSSLTMLFYRAIAAAIIMETNYIWSSLITIDDFSGMPKLKENPSYNRTVFVAGIEKILEFIKNGVFKAIFDSITLFREEYLEFNGKIIVNESSFIGDILNKGIDYLKTKLNNNGSGLAYRAMGVVVMLMAIRGIIYALSNMRLKVKNVLDNAKNQIDSTSGSASVLNKISNGITMDTDYVSSAVMKDIDFENTHTLKRDITDQIDF